jgi:uncharacterized repeat protein (TIGR04042 family)
MRRALEEDVARPLRQRGLEVAARFDWRGVAERHLPVYLKVRNSPMPETRFHVRWPDGRRETCYSPSLVVKDFFEEGVSYALDDFLSRSRRALQVASDRVEAKYGHACSLALGQLARIEAGCARFADQPGAQVACEGFVVGN